MEFCPCCGSYELEGWQVHAEFGIAWQYVTCVICGSTWVDDYTFIGYRDLVTPETDRPQGQESETR